MERLESLKEKDHTVSIAKGWVVCIMLSRGSKLTKTHIRVYPTNPLRPRPQHALLTDSVLASKADLEALLKLLKTKLEEAKRVSWEVPYGGHRLTLSVSSFFSQDRSSD